MTKHANRNQMRQVSLAEANRQALQRRASVGSNFDAPLEELAEMRIEDMERRAGEALAGANQEAKAILQEAQTRADELVKSAQEQAQQVRAAANAQADAIVAEATRQAAELQGRELPSGVQFQPAAEHAEHKDPEKGSEDSDEDSDSDASPEGEGNGEKGSE